MFISQKCPPHKKSKAILLTGKKCLLQTFKYFNCFNRDISNFISHFESFKHIVSDFFIVAILRTKESNQNKEIGVVGKITIFCKIFHIKLEGATSNPFFITVLWVSHDCTKFYFKFEMK